MKLHSIQFLRALAALLVVYAHSIDLQMAHTVSYQQNFFYLQNFGAIGADMFFVISGFIITYVANKYSGTEDGIDFFIKRFIRINPIYYIISILFLIAAIWSTWIPNMLLDWNHVFQTVIDTLLIMPLTNGYSPALSIGCTLSFEWLFYSIFILLILFNARNKPLLLLLVLVALVALGRLISFQDYRLQFITNPIVLEFLLGVGICWLYFRVNLNSILARILISTGFACYLLEILLGFGTISEVADVLNGKLSLYRFLLWGIPSAFMVAGCIFLEKNKVPATIWRNKWIQLVGDASYSIYLTHLCVFFFLHLFYLNKGYILNPDLSNLIHMCMATVVGIAVYTFIENPLLRFLQKTYSKKSPSLPATR